MGAPAGAAGLPALFSRRPRRGLYIASDNGRLYRLADVSASTPSGIGIVPLIIVGGLAAAGLAVLIAVWMLGRSRRGP